jgi:hypothetical protein
MGIEHFNFIKPAVAHGDTVKLQAHAFGDQVDAKVRAEAPGSTIQPAGLFSTAPYRGPNAPKVADDGLAKDATGKFTKLCPGPNGEGCNGWATKRTGYCTGHSRSMGLM